MTSYIPETSSETLNNVVRCERKELQNGKQGVVAKNIRDEILVAEGETEEKAISRLIAMSLFQRSDEGTNKYKVM